MGILNQANNLFDNKKITLSFGKSFFSYLFIFIFAFQFLSPILALAMEAGDGGQDFIPTKTDLFYPGLSLVEKSASSTPLLDWVDAQSAKGGFFTATSSARLIWQAGFAPVEASASPSLQAVPEEENKTASATPQSKTDVVSTQTSELEQASLEANVQVEASSTTAEILPVPVVGDKPILPDGELKPAANPVAEDLASSSPVEALTPPLPPTVLVSPTLEVSNFYLASSTGQSLNEEKLKSAALNFFL